MGLTGKITSHIKEIVLRARFRFKRPARTSPDFAFIICSVKVLYSGRTAWDNQFMN